jgi:hypothetical protein
MHSKMARPVNRRCETNLDIAETSASKELFRVSSELHLGEGLRRIHQQAKSLDRPGCTHMLVASSDAGLGDIKALLSGVAEKRGLLSSRCSRRYRKNEGEEGKGNRVRNRNNNQ